MVTVNLVLFDQVREYFVFDRKSPRNDFCRGRRLGVRNVL